MFGGTAKRVCGQFPARGETYSTRRNQQQGPKEADVLTAG